MASFNQITLLGRVGDIYVKTFSNGDKVVNASLATSKKYTDRYNQQQEDTQWHRLVIGGRLAGIAEQYVAKGDMLFVTGEMTYRKYEKDGLPNTMAEVRVQVLQLMPKGDRSEHQTVRAPQTSATIFPNAEEEDNKSNKADDFPF